MGGGAVSLPFLFSYPLARHITSFSSAGKTEELAPDKRMVVGGFRGRKYPESDTIEEEKEKARGKDGGHALINERLISSKLITGSWV